MKKRIDFEKHCNSSALIGLMLGFLSACGGGGEGGSGDDNNAFNSPGENNPGTPAQFVDTTASTGFQFSHGYIMPTGSSPEIFGGGVAAGDYDDDGDVDLFIVRGDIGPNLLYRNDGNNRFTDVAAVSGVANTNGESNYRHSGPVFADIDGDGDLDLFIGGIEGDPSFIFSNNLVETGTADFADVTTGSGIDLMGADYTLSAAFGDYDLDGDLDMMLSHWGTPRTTSAPGDTEHLWRNEGDNFQFTGVSETAGISASIIVDSGSEGISRDFTFTPTFARIDDDPYPDILSVADFHTSRIFINNGDGTGTFADRTDPVLIKDRSGMGSAVGDYDNDGDLDWFVTSIYGPEAENYIGNRLYQNNNGIFDPGNIFTDVTVAAGVADGGWGWGACFADFNNDGNLDIFHANGWDEQNILLETYLQFKIDPARLFISNGDGSFTESALKLGLADFEIGFGVVCADFENDGDVDILVTHRNTPAVTLWRNDLQGQNYLQVKLVGAAPNTEATGSRIMVTVNGTTQMREISIGNNYTSQNPTLQHFGLGAASQADTVKVEWVYAGGIFHTDTFTNVAANQRVVYTQPNLCGAPPVTC